MSRPQKISELLPLLFNAEHQWKYQLFSQWKTIFGKFSEKVYAESIHNDTLVLAVYDSCWLQELYTMSPLLLTCINKTLDKPYIKRLRFKRAARRVSKKPIHQEQTHIINQRPVVLTQREQQTLDSIKDTELAGALRNFLVRCLKERDLYEATNSHARHHELVRYKLSG